MSRGFGAQGRVYPPPWPGRTEGAVSADAPEAHRALTSLEKRRLALLGLPTFGLALAITIVSSYLPTVARQFTDSNVMIGLLIGGEGLFALLLPVLVGSWSDRLRTRLGGRMPFILVGAPLAAAGLLGMGLAGSLGAAAIAVALFFVGYFIAYEPYRALYPDLVGTEVAGRAQSTQAVWRGAGTVLALSGGGLLLAAGQVVPFATAAGIVLVACAGFVWLAVRQGMPAQDPSGGSAKESLRELRELLGSTPGLRAFFGANALLELSIAALKTFVVLWVTRGLGASLSGAALAIGAGAVFVLLGAAVSGKLADRFGLRRVMLIAVWGFGLTLLIPLFVTDLTVIAVTAPLIGFGGGALLTLPYALLVPLMPEGQHGALTGFYSLSRGVGVALGPLLGGVAVAAGSGLFESTEGYAAVWFVCAASCLAAVPLLRRVREA